MDFPVFKQDRSHKLAFLQGGDLLCRSLETVDNKRERQKPNAKQYERRSLGHPWRLREMRQSDTILCDNRQGRPSQDHRNHRKQRGYAQYF
jgi:hypothetical protein